MEIIRIPRIMSDTIKMHRLRGKTTGFVPTMGALHPGHHSLIKTSKRENDITAVSVYVNPLQFGPSEDFSRYPRNLEDDAENLDRAGVDILFAPEDALMYPAGFATSVEIKGLSDKLCGPFRPGHFSGVATVVAKLFNIVSPHRAYFGQKDYQQVLIIKRLVKDLNMDIDVVACPTVRETDGLAMSSRNAYLTPEQREAAVVIYKCLAETSRAVKSGIINADTLKRLMRDALSSQPYITEVQYCSLYDPETLDELDAAGNGGLLLAVAVRMGNTRLIDNLLV